MRNLAIKIAIAKMRVIEIPQSKHRNKIIDLIRDAENARKDLVKLTFSKDNYLNESSVAATIATTIRRYIKDTKYRCRQWRGGVYLVSSNIDEGIWKTIRRYL